MRLVRFLEKSYIDGGIREAGSEHWISEDTPLHAHMYDVNAESHGELLAPGDAGPMHLDHSGDTMVDSLHSTGYRPALAARDAAATESAVQQERTDRLDSSVTRERAASTESAAALKRAEAERAKG